MGFLKYMLKREAYNQTKKAFRDLGELAEENQQRKQSQNAPSEPPLRLRTAVHETATGTSDPDLKPVLQDMDDYDFEHFVADLWSDMGWQTDVSNQSVDKGIDVTATRHSPYPEKALIQAKRYGPNTTVGSPAVQQYASLKNQQRGVDTVIIVTTNRFSRNAKEIGEQLNVKLVNGDDLVGMIERLDAYDLVEEYAPTIPNGEPTGLLSRSSAAFDGIHENGAKLEVESSSVTGTESTFGRGSFSPTIDTASRSVATTETNTTDVTERSGREGRWRWVAYAVGVSLIGLVGSGTSSVFALLFLVGWIAVPAAIVWDKKWTDRKWKAAYALGALFLSVIAGGWYLYRRWRSIGFE